MLACKAYHSFPRGAAIGDPSVALANCKITASGDAPLDVLLLAHLTRACLLLVCDALQSLHLPLPQMHLCSPHAPVGLSMCYKGGNPFPNPASAERMMRHGGAAAYATAKNMHFQRSPRTTTQLNRLQNIQLPATRHMYFPLCSDLSFHAVYSQFDLQRVLSR